MARQFQFFFVSFLMACSFIGCTVAIPDVSALTELSSFSNKTTSPFDQENLGGVIYFSGYCLPQVTGFEFRLNSHPLWSPVSASAPTPSAGEYVSGSPEYDVDCSDGSFSFYAFESTAMDNFTLNSITSGPGDPEIIELRALGVEGIPTLVFKRPAPSAFVIYSNQYDYMGYLESSRDYMFKIRLKDANGKEVMVPTGQSINTTVSLTDLDSPALPTGSIYDATCTSPASASDYTFNAGDDEIQLCYRAISATTGHRVRIEASASGLFSAYQDVNIISLNSVISWLSAFNAAELLPPTLIKGLQYTVTMGINPVFSNNWTRNVSAFSGTLRVNSPQTNAVSFIRNGSDIDCASTAQIGDMGCVTTSTQKSFNLTVDSNYSGSNITLNVIAEPAAACSAGCSIYDSGFNYSISDYKQNSYYFGLSNGSSTYSQPYFQLMNNYNQSLRLNECQSAQIALANSDGVVIPASSLVFSLSSTGNRIDFYDSPNCANNLGNSTTVAFSTGSLVKQVFFQATSAQTDGTVSFIINDATNSFTKSFYIKSN